MQNKKREYVRRMPFDEIAQIGFIRYFITFYACLFVDFPMSIIILLMLFIGGLMFGQSIFEYE